MNYKGDELKVVAKGYKFSQVFTKGHKHNIKLYIEKWLKKWRFSAGCVWKNIYALVYHNPVVGGLTRRQKADGSMPVPHIYIFIHLIIMLQNGANRIFVLLTFVRVFIIIHLIYIIKERL